jgi:hypothetical protein
MRALKQRVDFGAVALAALFLGALRAPRAAASQTVWPQFRGPGAQGVSTNASLPERCSATENVAWKAEIPGRGWSSPIAWGDRVVCLDFAGRKVWSKSLEPHKMRGGWGTAASPVLHRDRLYLAGDRLLIRSAARLYCVGQKP